MGISSNVDERGIAEVVMDNPPVNAMVSVIFHIYRLVYVVLYSARLKRQVT